MELTKNLPIKIDIIPTSEGVVTCDFKTKGSKKTVKINVDILLYCQNPTYGHMTDMITSGVKSVQTSKNDNNHSLKFEIPKFIEKDRKKSFLIISIDLGEDPCTKVHMENIKVDTSPPVAKVESQQVKQEIVQQVQKPETLRQSLANQLLASTITPNARPRTFTSAPVDPFAQYATRQGGNRENIQTQDIRPRFRHIQPEIFPPLQTISKTIGKGSETIKGSKVAIVSIVRDEHNNGNLGRFLDCCQKLEKYHKNIIYIFIEGDSSDNTYDILNNWVEKRDGSVLEKIDMKYSPFLENVDHQRAMYFARLRNALIDLALSVPDTDEILMIDANYVWDGDIISQLRETNSDIVAPLAVHRKDNKGNYIFYDIWAFRKRGIEFWPFYPYAKDMEFDKPIDVDSVGSGYLIKRKVLDAGVRYNGDIDSEQVGFCNNARKFGFSIRVNPKVYIMKGSIDGK